VPCARSAAGRRAAPSPPLAWYCAAAVAAPRLVLRRLVPRTRRRVRERDRQPVSALACKTRQTVHAPCAVVVIGRDTARPRRSHPQPGVDVSASPAAGAAAKFCSRIWAAKSDPARQPATRVTCAVRLRRAGGGGVTAGRVRLPVRRRAALVGGGIAAAPKVHTGGTRHGKHAPPTRPVRTGKGLPRQN